ncbi:MAG: 2'-5' RNA ligase family protein [Candidatus Saccharimonas aalborgensis]
MKYSQKYSLVGFLEHQDIGVEFGMSDWPLHVTFADVFAIERNDVAIDRKLNEALQNQRPVLVEPKQQAKLGNTDVVLVEKTEELLSLHLLLVGLLEQNGAVFNTPAFTKGGFLPHCTIQKSSLLQTSTEITELSLVDMFPNNDWKQRKILATFELNG